MQPKKINLQEKLSLFQEHWTPKIIGELNGQHVKLAKIIGTFDWHKHDNEDELFLVIKGSFVMELRTERIEIGEGETIVIPRGVEHRPVAEHEAHILLFEPASTINTGDNTTSDLTQSALDWI
jgi:mannose-6-phosphate isomerase-like protein (cupin superfamily)